MTSGWRSVGTLSAAAIHLQSSDLTPKSKGKKLDKADQEFYRENRRIVDIKIKYTEADELALNKWT